MPFRSDRDYGVVTDLRVVKRYENAVNVIVAGLVAIIVIALVYVAFAGI
jgi:hypothetical protein